MFTDFDILVCVILALSTLVGLLRGFIKETLSLIGWVGAAALTFYSFDYVSEHISRMIKSTIVVNSLSVIVVFLISLAVVSLFNMMVLDNLRSVRAGMFDRALGMLFGLARGLLIISVIHAFIIINKPGPDDAEDLGPSWLKRGETFPITRVGGEYLYKRTRKYFDLEDLTKKRKVLKEEDSEKEYEEKGGSWLPSFLGGDKAEEKPDAVGSDKVEEENDKVKLPSFRKKSKESAAEPAFEIKSEDE